MAAASAYLSQGDPFGDSSDILDSLGYAISASIGASISNAVTYPLDLVITRLQLQQRLRREEGGQAEAEAKAKEDEQPQGASVATSVYKNEGGFSGFYAGVQQDTVRAMADSLLFFLFYSFLVREQQRRRRDRQGSDVVDELAVRFVAGALTQVATTPLTNVVKRKQTAGPAGSELDTWEILSQIRREEGLAGLWSGYSASLVLALRPGLAFVIFEAFNRALRHPAGLPVTIGLAALSKAIAASITYPFSVARTRMQAQEPESKSNQEKSKDAFSVVQQISEQEGFQSLYSGVGLEAGKELVGHGTTLVAQQATENILLMVQQLLSTTFSTILGRYRSEVDARQLRERARENMEYYKLGVEQATQATGRIEDALPQSRAIGNETDFIGEYIETGEDGSGDLYKLTGLDGWLKGDR